MSTNLSLVLGGAGSGKSAFAESLVAAAPRHRIYVATAQPFDAEMTDKIARHRDMRGPSWDTREAPVAVAAALAGVAADDRVLIDCATLWLSNLMLTGADVDAQTAVLLAAVADCPCPVVVVSNETGMGIVPDNALARQFRAAQGLLNQRLAAAAALVVLVVAGLPLVLKGALPDGMADGGAAGSRR